MVTSLQPLDETQGEETQTSEMGEQSYVKVLFSATEQLEMEISVEKAEVLPIPSLSDMEQRRYRFKETAL